MMCEVSTQSPIPVRVYGYESRWLRWSLFRTIVYLVWLVGWYGYIIIDNLLRGDRVGVIVFSVLAGLVMLGTLYQWLNERNTCLEVLPTGLRLYWRGQQLSASWDDLGRIANIKQPCYVDWEGITLRQAHWDRGRWQPLLLGYRLPRFIPLWSGRPLWDRELGNDLRYYAPWVFDDAVVAGTPNYVPQQGYYGAEASHA